MLKKKRENKQFDELTEEQQALLALYRAYLADYYLLGEEIFQAAMLSSGVGVLSFYFSVLSSPLDGIAGAWQGRILCDLLSYRFCLSHIRAFEKAYYYLTNAKRNSSIHAIRDFTQLSRRNEGYRSS